MIDENDDDVQNRKMDELHESGDLPEFHKQLDAFMDKVQVPGPNEEAFFEERRRKGLGVGLDEYGNLTKERDRSDIEPSKIDVLGGVKHPVQS